MKRVILLSATILGLSAGHVYAEGCQYGGGYASGHGDKLPVMAAIEETEAELLARLKREQEAAELEALLTTPVTYN